MAAAGNAGASAPAAVTVTVRGEEIAIDQAAASSWQAFNLYRVLDGEDGVFAKADAAFGLASLVSGLSQDDIVERCGGDRADARDVIAYALEIVQAATPKN